MILTGNDIKQYIAHGGLSFSPKLQDIQYQQNGVDLILESISEVVVNRFALGCTREWVRIPNDLMAFVGIRSTWARCGIGMQGLTIIDAGFEGQITLEIIHFGLRELPVGQRFAHIVFEKLCTPSIPYNGKYQLQRGITQSREDNTDDH